MKQGYTLPPITFENNALDLFRLFAICEVVVGHLYIHLGGSSRILEQAIFFVRRVPILFILCGFLAAASFTRYAFILYQTLRANLSWFMGMCNFKFNSYHCIVPNSFRQGFYDLCYQSIYSCSILYRILA